MLRKLLIFFLLFPLLTNAAPVSWNSTNGVLEPLAGYVNSLIRGTYFTSTSTTLTNTFPRLSASHGTTTNATSTNLYVSGQTTLASLSGVLKAASGIVSAATAGVDYENALTFSAPLSRSVDTISCVVATRSVAGCLSSTDYTTFDNKISSTTIDTESEWEAFQGGTDYVTVTAGDISSANLITALSDETGSGNAVFSTLPVFSGFTSNASSSITALSVINGTTTNATSTNSVISTSLILPFSTTYSTLFQGALGLIYPASRAPALAVATSTSANATAYLPLFPPKSFMVASSTWTSSSTDAQYTTMSYGETIATTTCYTDAGTLLLQVGDGTNWSNQLSISTATSTFRPTSNNVFPKNGAKVTFRIGTPASSPTKAWCTFERIFNQN